MTQSIKKQLQGMKILHLAFIAGLVMFALVGYLVDLLEVKEGNILDGILLYVVVAFTIAGFGGGAFLFKKMLSRTPKDISLGKKIESYRTAWIIKIALLEGPAFLSLVGFLLTRDFLFLIIAGFLVVMMAMAAPTASRISSELELDCSESLELEEAV